MCPSLSMMMPVPAASPSTWNGPCCWTMWVVIDTVEGSTAATTDATLIVPAEVGMFASTACVDVGAAAGSSVVRPARYPPPAPAATAASVNAAAAANRLRRGAWGCSSGDIGALSGADGGRPGGGYPGVVGEGEPLGA